MTCDSVVTIRHATAADREEIHAVEAAAFGQEDEARLVEALIEAGHVILSLVAVYHEQIVGHILFSPMTVEMDGKATAAVCLAPLAVHPEHQNRWAGSALVRTGLAELCDTGHDAVFVLGHPTYYPRFGFRPGREFGVHYQDDRDAFMAIELVDGALADVSGRAVFAPKFAPYE